MMGEPTLYPSPRIHEQTPPELKTTLDIQDDLRDMLEVSTGDLVGYLAGLHHGNGARRHREVEDMAAARRRQHAVGLSTGPRSGRRRADSPAIYIFIYPSLHIVLRTPACDR